MKLTTGKTLAACALAAAALSLPPTNPAQQSEQSQQPSQQDLMAHLPSSTSIDARSGYVID